MEDYFSTSIKGLDFGGVSEIYSKFKSNQKIKVC